MVRQMERGTMQLMAKRGKSIRQIAKELGRNRRTVARALQEPADRTPAPRRRASAVDLYRPHIERWITEGLTAVRMLELARSAEEQPYTGSRSNFGAMVRRVWAERDQQQAADDVPICFEGLPAEYLQVDWGRYATCRSPRRRRRDRRGISWPAGSRTAAGPGCASPPICARRRWCAAWWTVWRS